MVEDDYRQMVKDANLVLANAERLATRNFTFEAKTLRELMTEFVNIDVSANRCL